MTDHPKPIARYALETVDAHGYECDCDAGMVQSSTGDYMLVADHEAVLAAKDARIAELEQALRNIHDTDTTPEYEVRQPDRKGNLPSSGRYWLTPREIAENAMPELRALLEKKS